MLVPESVKALYALTGGTSIAIFLLLTISFSTPNWTECIAIRDDKSNNKTCSRETVDNPQPPNERYTGLVEFGIIYGNKQFNYGYGKRDAERFFVFQEYKDEFNTNYIIVTLAFTICAILVSIPASILGIVNFKMVPVEIINGRLGLYTWNIIGFVSSVTSMSVYIAVYSNEIRYNALSEENKEDDFCSYSTSFGYSFWLLVVSVGLFFVNIALIVLTELIVNTPECLKRQRRTGDDMNQATAIELEERIMY